MNYDFTGLSPWSKIEGWCTLEEAVVLQLIVKQLSPKSVLVELGSYQGRSSIAIAAVMPPDCILYCVDHFQGSEEHETQEKWRKNSENLLDTFVRNVEAFGVKERIAVMPMTTLEACEKFKPESINFLFVDADHSYDGVKADLEHWYPKLKPGGLLVCDDYEDKWPGVIRAIGTLGLQGRLIAPSLWFHQKPLISAVVTPEPVENSDTL